MGSGLHGADGPYHIATTLSYGALNRTDSPVQVGWVNSHPFDVNIEDKNGTVWHLNDFMPAPVPVTQPTTADPHTESYRVLVFDPTDVTVWPPTLTFRFLPKNAPYTVRLSLNSTSHHIAASAQLTFAPTIENLAKNKKSGTN